MQIKGAPVQVCRFAKFLHRDLVDGFGPQKGEKRLLELHLAVRDGILPLKQDISLIVCGNYADVVNTGDHGSSRVWDRNIITPYRGLKAVFPTTILAGARDGKKGPVTVPDAEAIQAADEVAVICAGFDYRTEGEYFANMNYKLMEKPHNGGGDRLILRLSPEEAALIDEWKEYADAVIMHCYAPCQSALQP